MSANDAGRDEQIAPESPKAGRATPAAASIVIPTRDRPQYLGATLASILPQARAEGCDVFVIDDSAAQTAKETAMRSGARYIAHDRPLGANAARNTGLQMTSSELIVFTDDDVIACDGWLKTLLAAAQAHPEVEVFAGAIDPLLEGHPPRSCGREAPPITTLQLGGQNAPTRFAWSANMALRRSAVQRAGELDASLHGQGEEQEWQERLEAVGPARAGAVGARHQALYVAGARVAHRRTPADSRLRALVLVALRRGAESRRFDSRRDEAPSIVREAWTLLGCAGHVLRYRCPNGLTMLAHSAGRLRQALAERAASTPEGQASAASPLAQRSPPDDFLSGESGTVGGVDAVRREIADRAQDGLDLISGRRMRLARASRSLPTLSVLAIGVTREQHRARAQAILAELRSSRHTVEIATIGPGQRGKFENLNVLLAEHPVAGHDWLIVFDDDIQLPRGFLDHFLFLAQRFGLDLAQPAHRRASHAAWRVTRRQRRSVVHETQFVETGPLSAFADSTFATLLPFPPLRMGWGLDAHWAAIARQHGWRCGVIDAVPIKHRIAPAASTYSRQQTIAEARAFLAQHPYLPAHEAQRTLAVHRRW
ncbi:MAG: glycosyltransferase [Solirubrobacteraceae bacterium]